MSPKNHKELFLKKSLNNKGFSSHPLPNDASFRKYERIITPEGSFIFMDASLDKDSVKPFVSIAKFLHKKGYSTPKIFAKEEELGFLLLEDLGETSYASLLANSDKKKLKETERKLYKKAIDLLVDLHLNVPHHEAKISSYQKELLMEEAVLLIDWYLPTLTGNKVSESIREEYLQSWKKSFNCIHYPEECLVLRDYHIDNLIWLEDRSDLKKIGVLDFQDAVKGSYAYDVVSLLEDARRDVDTLLAQEMLNHYLDQIKKLDRKKFLSDYKILGVQRGCKIAGIFARKAMRDNDSRYLKHLPRVWKYIKNNISHPILEPLKVWFQKVDIPVMRK